jgi:hypothetical protein
VHVEHDRAVELALAGGVLGDVGDPQLVRSMPGEVAVDQVGGKSGVVHRPATLPPPEEAGQSGPAHQQLHRTVPDRDAQPEP